MEFQGTNEGGSLGWIKESSLNSVIRDQILNTKLEVILNQL